MDTQIPIKTVLEIHRRKITDFGGLGGVRDKGILEAALAQPWQGFSDVEFYPTLEEKAARLCYEIVTQHPFVDGNKRTGAALLGDFLRVNGVHFFPSSYDYYQAVYGVAEGSLTYEDLLKFVRKNAAR